MGSGICWTSDLVALPDTGRDRFRAGETRDRPQPALSTRDRGQRLLARHVLARLAAGGLKAREPSGCFELRLNVGGVWPALHVTGVGNQHRRVALEVTRGRRHIVRLEHDRYETLGGIELRG